MKPSTLLGVLFALAMAGGALATPRETVTFTSVPSDGILGDPVNAVRTNTFSGGYTLGRVDFSGTLTSVQSRTWRTDSRVLVTAPGGQSATIQPFTSGSTYATLNFSGSLFMPAGTGFGLWTFRFYEEVDDGGPGVVDATMTLTVTLTDEPPAPPASVDLGVIATPGTTVTPVSVPASGWQWYHFRLNRAVRSDLGRYLDIDTANSSLPADQPSGLLQDDTEMVLFNAGGAMIALDDDSCQGLMSQLSFGAGTRPATGDGLPYAGQNGILPEGDYYLAVGPYRLTPLGGYWALQSTGSRSGTIGVRFMTNLASGVDCLAPTIAQQPTDLAAHAGDTVQLSASALGTGTLAYQWTHDGNPLTDGGHVSGAHAPVLNIANVAAADAGSYTLVVTNNCGTTPSNQVTVWVVRPPCDPDFNGDGDDRTDADIEAFFACVAGHCCPICGTADYNGDGDVATDADIEAFFRVLAGGPC
jgi:hypothetical protein